MAGAIGLGPAAVASFAGWTCSSATVTQALATGRVGGCARGDGAAAFSVSPGAADGSGPRE